MKFLRTIDIFRNIKKNRKHHETATFWRKIAIGLALENPDLSFLCGKIPIKGKSSRPIALLHMGT